MPKPRSPYIIKLLALPIGGVLVFYASKSTIRCSIQRLHMYGSQAKFVTEVVHNLNHKYAALKVKRVF